MEISYSELSKSIKDSLISVVVTQAYSTLMRMKILLVRL